VDAPWLPQGSWQALYGVRELQKGDELFVGSDIGGERSGTAMAAVNTAGVVRAEVWQGDQAALDVADGLRRLHARYRLRAVGFDPWRFQTEASRRGSSGRVCRW
jgi:hypothetical protein